MRFDIITIFPHIFDSYLNESLVKRAREKKIIDVSVHNLRDYVPRPPRGKPDHKKVDDRPFGGGPGMVLKIEPIYNAVGSILKISNLKSQISKQKKTRTILFSTRGHKFDKKTAKRLSKYDRLILICGRYEGVDERVAEHIADEEISMGDFVLSGGELPALVLMEAVSRHLPGFLGKEESLEEINGSFPTYTRPEIFNIPSSRFSSSSRRTPRSAGQKPRSGSKKKWPVPKVLLSGNHQKIEEWRRGGGK